MSMNYEFEASPLPDAHAYVLYLSDPVTYEEADLILTAWKKCAPDRALFIAPEGAEITPLPVAAAYVMHTDYLLTDAAAATIGAAWKERMPDAKLLVVDGGGRLDGIELDAAADRARIYWTEKTYKVTPIPWADMIESHRERWRDVARAVLDA